MVTRRYGGEARLRDFALLESAALAPQHMMFGEYTNKTLHSQAATYWFAMVMNRPFAEKNNETGLVACEIFLQMNGHELNLSSAQIEEILKRLAARQINTKEKLLQSIRIRAVH